MLNKITYLMHRMLPGCFIAVTFHNGSARVRCGVLRSAQIRELSAIAAEFQIRRGFIIAVSDNNIHVSGFRYSSNLDPDMRQRLRNIINNACD